MVADASTPALAVTVGKDSGVTVAMVLFHQGATVPAAEVALLNSGPLLPNMMDEELLGAGPLPIDVEVVTYIGAPVPGLPAAVVIGPVVNGGEGALLGMTPPVLLQTVA